ALQEVARGRFEPGKPGGKEDHAGTKIGGETAQTAEKIAILPADQSVKIGADGVELDASTELDAAKLARDDLHRDRHPPRRRLVENRHDLGVGEDTEREDRASGRLEFVGGIVIAFHKI